MTEPNPSSRPNLSLALAGSIVCAVVVSAQTGCVATVRHEPAFVEVDEAPAVVETYPHRVYEGNDVYYVRDHWYARRGTRWGYYREAPPPLQRERGFVQRAPRAARPEHGHRVPARVEADPRPAPPAVRVR